MKNLQYTTNKSKFVKKTYLTPKVEQIQLDHEISMVMMSLPPTEMPQQDPLMSLKGFRLFR